VKITTGTSGTACLFNSQLADLIVAVTGFCP
jgi:hypothetical protein